MRQYSQRMDALVQGLFAEAGPLPAPVAAFALGGYGRFELCLHSDIDLLVLFAEPIGAQEERFLGRFLNPLWDLGLTVGHHVREIHEGPGDDANNPEFLLALTDARPVAGDATVLERFLAQADVAATHARTLDSLRTLVSARHARFNSTIYQQEPDVKESPGGLRDLFGAHTIAKLTDPALLQQGGAGARALGDAEEFLMRVRAVLHLETGKHHDTLTHELQERVAERLGYVGASERERVERCMGDYFRHARAIDRTLRWALRTAPVPVGPNLVRAADGVRFIDTVEASERPESWVSLFQAALDHDCAVADEALACVAQHAGRYSVTECLPAPRHRAALRQLLVPRRGLYARLSEMHECGVLGQWFPEFKAIDCRVVRDFYHKYTVDEHTLLTIRNLERLLDGDGDRGRFSRLLAAVPSPERLVLALLFHDIGKGQDEHHSIVGARLARAMCRRLDLDAEATADVEFLILEHLKMSHVAFRRDTDDPDIVRQFAELVGTEHRLQMLCLLTLADVEAVSLETLTPWREELLWRLYVDTYNHLTHTYADELIDRELSRQATLLRECPSDVAAADVSTFIEGWPRRYLQQFEAQAVYDHVRAARALTADGLAAWVEPEGEGWRLTVLGRDRPFLFSNLCGVLSLYGMDIQRGCAFTKSDGLVVDSVRFADAERFLALNDEGRDVLLATLRAALSGSVDVAARLRGREQGALRPRPVGMVPVVHADNESSPRFTIVEIVTENAPGLLYRVSRAMSEAGCAVDLVLINTEGRRAVDVFHLTRDGAKLSPSQHAELTAHLHRVLEGRP